MPISQDRFITVIEGAKRIFALYKQTQDILNDEWPLDITTANAVLERTQDTNARNIIAKLLNRLSLIRELNFQNTAETTELIAIVIAEDLHFQKNKKRNHKSAEYRRFTRANSGIIPRENREAAPTPPVSRSVPITETVELENHPHYKQFEAEMAERARNWYKGPGAPTPPPNYDPETGTFSTPIPELSPEPLGGEQVAQTPSSIKKRTIRDMVICTSCQYEYEKGNICLRCSPFPPLTPAAETNSEPLGEQAASQIPQNALKPRIGKDGITRHLPSDEELNQSGQISPSSNLL